MEGHLRLFILLIAGYQWWIRAEVLFPELNLQGNEWTLLSRGGRSPCTFLNSDDVLHLGTECIATTTVHTSFFEMFGGYHTTRTEHSASNERNFESMMLFDVRLLFRIQRSTMLQLERFIDKLLNSSTLNSDQTRPAIFVYFNLEEYLTNQEIWLTDSFAKDRLASRVTVDTAPTAMDTFAYFQFDFNIPWSVHFHPSRNLEFHVQLNVDNVTRLVASVDNDGSLVQEWNSLQTILFVEFRTISISYVLQPIKFDFHAPHLQEMRQEQLLKARDAQKSRDACAALGSPCAIVLRRVNIANLSTSQVKVPSQMRIIPSALTSSTLISHHSPSRIFCGVFVTGRSHMERLPALRDTWALHCNGFLAFSTENDDSIPAINLPHIGEERYSNMWQKSRSIWKYIHTFYRDDFDWFLLGGDDMYVIMEHLRWFLDREDMKVYQASNEGKHGVYLGRKLIEPASALFNATEYVTGGPGYILDRQALSVLWNNIDQEHCNPYVLSPAEDVFVGDCLARSTPSIHPFETRDELNRQRFLQYAPGTSYLYGRGDWPKNVSSHWLSKYDHNISTGHDCCSDTMIGIHAMDTFWMSTLDDFIHRCPRESINEYYALHGEDYLAYTVHISEPQSRPH
jgi:hypothetical protein